MSGLQADILFLAACALPWLIISWIRIRHYARYFQLDEYDIDVYRLRLSHTQPEDRYLLLTCLPIFAVPTLACMLVYISTSGIYQLIIPVMSGLAAILTIFRAPQDRLAADGFIQTRRTVRLFITASIVQIIPILLAGLIIINSHNTLLDPKNSPEASLVGGLAAGIVIITTSVGVGPSLYWFSPLALPITNVINYPIEAFLRHFHPTEESSIDT